MSQSLGNVITQGMSAFLNPLKLVTNSGDKAPTAIPNWLKDTRAFTPNGEYGIFNQLVDWWAGTDSSYWGTQADCSKASGGASTQEYTNCMKGMRQAVVDAAKANPVGAAAYVEITSGNPLEILNPFSEGAGNGFGDTPVWIWIGLGMVGIWAIGEIKK